MPLPSTPLLRPRLRALSAARRAITLSMSGCGAQAATVNARHKITPAPVSTGVAAAPPLSIVPAPSLLPAAPPPPGACNAGMSLVAGNYCLTPEQRCLAHQDIPSEDGKVAPDPCTRYEEPVTCPG